MNAVFNNQQADVVDDYSDGVVLELRDGSQKPFNVPYSHSGLIINPTDVEWTAASNT